MAAQSPRRLPPAVFPSDAGHTPREDVVPARGGPGCPPTAVRLAAGLRPGRADGRGTPPEIQAGDRLRCFAQLSAPRGPRNPGGFDDAAREVHRRHPQPAPRRVPGVHLGGPAGRLAESYAALGRRPRRSNRLLEAYMAPAPPRWPKRCCWASGNNSNRAAPKTSWPSAWSTSWSSPDCTWAFWQGPFSGSSAALPCREVGRRLVAAATLGYMLLVDAGPPVVRATVLVLVFAPPRTWAGIR